jgi:hypothetical protein
MSSKCTLLLWTMMHLVHPSRVTAVRWNVARCAIPASYLSFVILPNEVDNLIIVSSNLHIIHPCTIDDMTLRLLSFVYRVFVFFCMRFHLFDPSWVPSSLSLPNIHGYTRYLT